MDGGNALSYEEMWDRFMAFDSRYDGVFYAAVKTTKIYCRPSCRSRKPKQVNVTFYRERSEAEQAGFRACKRCRPETAHAPQEELVRNVVSFLNSRYNQKLELGDIAAHVGVSAFHLERLFKQETAETPRACLERIRIDKAAQLLTSSAKTNLEIGYEVGFRSPSSFYKVFRRLRGCSPNEYRTQLRKERSQ